MEIKTVFVATPIGKKGTKERIHTDGMFDSIFRHLIDKFKCEFIRADKRASIGVISESIYSDIKNSDVIIADTKWINPNVFYEIGLAHALNKPVILMNPEEEEPPFDIAHLKYIPYPQDIFENEHNSKIIDELVKNLIKVFEHIKETDANPIPAKDITGITDSLSEKVDAISNDVKEIFLALGKRFNADFIEGEKDAFDALTNAIKEAKIVVKTTRFSEFTVVDSYPDFFAAIQSAPGHLQSGFHRIIAVNSPNKLAEVHRLVVNNPGNKLTIYLTQEKYNFEIVIIDNKEAFIHFRDPDQP
ncbi:MAG: nucleoside 2-deoxyribosyltransferase, partial [Fibromonadaceae bacterium]|nr:nucleoside 2-deoxyribosyltransferase [Fibromonadaceae bacterium]